MEEEKASRIGRHAHTAGAVFLSVFQPMNLHLIIRKFQQNAAHLPLMGTTQYNALISVEFLLYCVKRRPARAATARTRQHR